MSKGSNTTRSGANTRAMSVINGNSHIIVQDGFPKEVLDKAMLRLNELNSEFGFNPDVHFLNKEGGFGHFESGVGAARAEENRIEVGVKASTIENDGYVIDHEYGHLFDVKNLTDLREIKRMIKLNPDKASFREKYQKLKSQNEAIKSNSLYPKWKRLNEIYKEDYNFAKENGGVDKFYKYTNLKEYAAENFALVRRVGLSNIRDKEIAEFYNILISLPRTKR